MGWPFWPLFQDKWVTFLGDLEKVRELTVERCYSKDTESQDIQSFELHGYGDASKEAYGACIYLRYECGVHTYCKLLTSVTRVAPMANQSIPRLELLACLVTSWLINRMKQALKNVLKIEHLCCWTDSSIGLAWINVTIPPESWKYCPTESNPADITSRGAKATDLMNNSKWWEGPELLKSPRGDWPILPTSASSGEVDIEWKKTSKTRSIPTSCVYCILSLVTVCVLVWCIFWVSISKVKFQEFYHSFYIFKISGTSNNEEKSYKWYLPLSFSNHNETSPKLVHSKQTS